jgi:ABC-2 type transport system ATP-binding protein
MRRLAAEGKTVFISSHVLGEVQQICTRVAIINLGQLVTESTVEELTRGHGEFSVTLERPAEALALLQAQPWSQGARRGADNTIITQAPEGRGRDLNLFLVKAGFAPDAIGPYAQDLEEVFLQLTNSGRGAAL